VVLLFDSSESNLICALSNTCYNIRFTMPHDALSSALFLGDQWCTTEREKIRLQQSQGTSNVISEKSVFIDTVKPVFNGTWIKRKPVLNEQILWSREYSTKIHIK
jgi:hypothetical protein